MRTTLAASMLNAISRNEKQGTLEGRLFEVASIYIPESLPLTSYPDERKSSLRRNLRKQRELLHYEGHRQHHRREHGH